MPVVRNPQFYFKEGFCWIDVNSTYLKARLKGNGVFDVLSMSLFSMTLIPDWYYVSLINSEFISLYVDNFINNTSHFQINDARQLPIVIPDKETLERVSNIFNSAIQKKRSKCSTDDLECVQSMIDALVTDLYSI